VDDTGQVASARISHYHGATVVRDVAVAPSGLGLPPGDRVVIDHAARPPVILSRRIPVLLLHGSADRSAPIDGARKLVERRPDWKLSVLEGVDHHPWLQQPGACLRVIREWLDEQEGLSEPSSGPPVDRVAGSLQV
jgi:pimeloyl-ACP methyl ester carboxylesterase